MVISITSRCSLYPQQVQIITIILEVWCEEFVAIWFGFCLTWYSECCSTCLVIVQIQFYESQSYFRCLNEGEQAGNPSTKNNKKPSLFVFWCWYDGLLRLIFSVRCRFCILGSFPFVHNLFNRRVSNPKLFGIVSVAVSILKYSSNCFSKSVAYVFTSWSCVNKHLQCSMQCWKQLCFLFKLV